MSELRSGTTIGGYTALHKGNIKRTINEMEINSYSKITDIPFLLGEDFNGTEAHQPWGLHSDLNGSKSLIATDYKLDADETGMIKLGSNTGKVSMVIDGEYYASNGQSKVFHEGFKPEASSSVSGFMSSEDKAKLDSMGNIVDTLDSSVSNEILSANMGRLLERTKTKRINLTGQGQTGPYRKTVIALCNANNGDSSASHSFTNGIITMSRGNGIYASTTINVKFNEAYYAANSINAQIMTHGYYGCFIRPCIFRYRGLTYGGIEININGANADKLEFNGATNFDIFAVDYINIDTDEVYNEEINNSIVYEDSDKVIIDDVVKINGANILTENNAKMTNIIVGDPLVDAYIPSNGIYSEGNVIVQNKLRVDFNGSPETANQEPSVSLSIGNNDTGFDWIEDGVFDVKTNGSKLVRFGQDSTNFNKKISVKEKISLFSIDGEDVSVITVDDSEDRITINGMNSAISDTVFAVTSNTYDNKGFIFRNNVAALAGITAAGDIKARGSLSGSDNKFELKFNDDNECLEFLFN